jgi:hypothetical protein
MEFADVLQDLTPVQFVERYEVPQLPVVLTGLTEGWSAVQQWTPDQLLTQYGSHKFKVERQWHTGSCNGSA